ncbi:MAG: hypothetical protein RMK32_04045 [Anaerolineae bacterium]|nr:hypothetical protein [Thermoflexus sp.]MDW8064784.1 hypothetical protein [Anaerolineae bacterium]
MGIGLAMMGIGWVLAFGMTLRVIPPSLELSLLAYAASIGGLWIAMVGSAVYVREKQRLE